MDREQAQLFDARLELGRMSEETAGVLEAFVSTVEGQVVLASLKAVGQGGAVAVFSAEIGRMSSKWLRRSWRTSHLQTASRRVVCSVSQRTKAIGVRLGTVAGTGPAVAATMRIEGR